MRNILIALLFLTSCTVGHEDIEEATENHDIVLVDFWADGCKPCKMIEPYIEEIRDEYDQVEVLSVDINSEDGLHLEYNITHVPTVIIFYKGKQHTRFVGYHYKFEYVEALNEILGYIGTSGSISGSNNVVVNRVSSRVCPVE